MFYWTKQAQFILEHYSNLGKTNILAYVTVFHNCLCDRISSFCGEDFHFDIFHCV
jgi:hypothetical protein